MKHRIHIGPVLAAALSLSACGGGGGVNSAGSTASGATAPAATPTPTPTPGTTEEMRNLTTVGSAVNVDFAFSSGWLGQGVTVGIIDDGIATSSELAGQIDTTASRDFGRYLADDKPRNMLGDAKSDHGTQIADVIAARQDGSGTLGYAPKAKVAALRITDVSADGSEIYSAAHEIEAIDHAIAQRLKILNRSLAGSTNAGLASAMARYAAAAGLMINSAGNNGGTAPTEAPNVTAANRKSWLFVGALTPGTTQLADYSAPAGSLADRYVVAPGSTVATGADNVVALFSGTSAAAPIVAGLAADILSKWPQLSGQQVGDIILNTARDLGAPGVDAVFGHGVVDFRAALQPVDPTLSNGAVATAAAEAVLVVPAAVDAQILETALGNVTILDRYGRDYSASLASRVVASPERNDDWLRRRVLYAGQGTAQLAFDRLSTSLSYVSAPANLDGIRETALVGGRITFGTERMSLHASLREQDVQQSDLLGMAIVQDAALAYAPQMDLRVGIDRVVGQSRLGLTLSTGGTSAAFARAATVSFARGGTTVQASLVAETGSVFGAPASGALRLGRGATTLVTEARQTIGFGAWRLDAYASLGATRLTIDEASLIMQATPLIGTRFGLQAQHPALGGLLGFSVAQPLTIEHGRARLSYGAGYDVESGALFYRSVDVPLTGKRRLILSSGYSTALAGGQFRLGLMHALHSNETGALISFTTGLGFLPTVVEGLGR